MNTFECRSCKRQFQNSTPSCPSNQSHIVALVRTAQSQLSPAQNRLASNTLTLKTEGPVEHGGELPTNAPLSPGDWTESDRENTTQRWKDACLYNLRANNFRRYTRIIERRDFYRWFYKYTASRGYHTRWALAASIVATGAHEVAIMNPGEKNRLHTPEWQRIFTLVCDDNSILAATRDLGLPELLRTQWINQEKRFLH